MTPETLEHLDEMLSLEAAPAEALTEEDRQRITEAFESAENQDAMFKLAGRVQAALDEFGENLRALYGAAVYQELIGEEEDAGKGFVRLARALLASKDYAGARELALRALPLWPDGRAVRALIETWAHIDDEAALEEDLTLAGSLCPQSPDLLWYEARMADDQGRVNDAGRLAVDALAEFVKAKMEERAEEPLLRVLESTEPAVFRSLVRIIPRMVRAGMRDLFDMTIEFAEARIYEMGLAGDLMKAMEVLLTKRGDCADVRPIYVRAMVENLGGTDEIADFVKECGLADPDTPLEDALATLKEMFKLRPGAFVEHANFGVGQIAAHDGSFLIINFGDKPNHRMAMEIAGRSLRPLPAACLRVAVFSKPDEIRHEIEQDPVGLLVRALNDLGGEVKARDLRDCLAGGPIPSDEWSNWWKRAREAAVDDHRIDTSQAFRQVYRLPGAVDEDEVELPALPKKGEAASVVRIINRLLNHHPEWEEQARAEYASELVARATGGDVDQALAAVPLMIRWLPERREEWLELANRAFRHEPGVAGGVTAEEQEELLRIGLEAGNWQQATFSALASRFLAIRTKALAALRERLGDNIVPALREALLHSDDRPNTQLALLRLALAGSLDEAGLEPVDLLLGLAKMLSDNPPQKLRQSALELMDPHDDLGAKVRENRVPEERLGEVVQAARELALSETGVEPMVFFLSETGYAELADTLVTDTGPRGVTDPIEVHFDNKFVLMTRATFDANEERIRELEGQLANEFPKLIAQARSLGDLSENAEYHDAKERQGIADANLRQLRSVMDNAAVIEDIDFPEDRVTVGTEVVVKDLTDQSERTFWLLGQGDSSQDPNVINYLAPVGQALVGKRVGDTARVDAGGNIQELQVLSLTRRLP